MRSTEPVRGQISFADVFVPLRRRNARVAARNLRDITAGEIRRGCATRRRAGKSTIHLIRAFVRPTSGSIPHRQAQSARSDEKQARDQSENRAEETNHVRLLGTNSEEHSVTVRLDARRTSDAAARRRTSPTSSGRSRMNTRRRSGTRDEPSGGSARGSRCPLAILKDAILCWTRRPALETNRGWCRASAGSG